MKAPTSALTPDLMQRLTGAVDPTRVLVDEASIEEYGRDKTKDLFFPPEAAVLVESAEEIAEVMRIADDAGIPITPRGAGTGLSGGALPVEGGIVLGTQRMRKIIDVDRANRMVVVQAGVVTGEINRALEAFGLFYPPDPASLDSCTIGGNVAENAGGPRAVKYGVTHHFLTGASVTLPNAQRIALGGKLRKNVTGYNLLGLLCGSEGTLGIFDELTFRVVQAPRFREVYLAEFPTPEDACLAVEAIMEGGLSPSALELMSREAIDASYAYLGSPPPNNDFGAALLIEIDAEKDGEFAAAREKIGEACLSVGAEDLFIADTAAKQEKVWGVRRGIGHAVKERSVYEEEDVVVPRAQMGAFFTQAREILRRHRLDVIMYGHAGDGNIHCNILQGQHTAESWADALGPAASELFALVKSMGGTLTGEHGVGLIQREHFKRFVDPAELEIVRRVKSLFDPKGILNPGKMF